MIIHLSKMIDPVKMADRVVREMMFSNSSIFSPRFIASLKSFLNKVVVLTVYFVFLMPSGLQRVRPNHCIP